MKLFVRILLLILALPAMAQEDDVNDPVEAPVVEAGDAGNEIYNNKKSI